MDRPVDLLLLSDFNLDNLAALLNNDEEQPPVRARSGPYGQLLPLLLEAGHGCWQENSDVTLVWTRPQAVSVAFHHLLGGDVLDPEAALADVDRFCAALAGLEGRTGTVLVPLWTVAPELRTGGMLDWDPRLGVARALAAMNTRLLERLDDTPICRPLDTGSWLRQAGPRAFQPKLWYLAKVPFSPEVFLHAVRDVKSTLRGLAGATRKLIAVDLDDTLWGGVAGDLGWENIQLGGHDPEGEAFVDFQRGLLALQKRGILLAVVSKNEEAVALEVLRRHPEMVLREEHFAALRINWRDKAQNLAELAAELNLGPDAVVFIDDHPLERARVAEALPEVLVPDWPEDRMLFRRALWELRCFNVPALTGEDRQRTALYRSEQRRARARTGFTTLEEWLATLDTSVEAEPLSAANLPRAAQLLNKTNQMNLTTRRLSAAELWAWVQGENRRLWTYRVRDRFGDSGLTGMASLQWSGDEAQMVDFVLSCRVFGRQIEATMLHTLLRYASDRGLQRLRADYLPTARNTPCLRFLEGSGARTGAGPHTFLWDPRAPSPVPAGIRLHLVS